MGASLGGGGGSEGYRAMSDINVTPMVDIMLVLLIIFMVTAPMMNQGVEVDLPNAAAKPMVSPKEPLVVSVGPQGTPFVESKPYTIEQLADKIRGIKANDPQLLVYVRGDKNATYGSVMKVMGQLQVAGVDKVGLVTEEPR